LSGIEFLSASADLINQIRTGGESVNLQLYKNYSQNFRKGVSLTMGEDNADLQVQFEANVSRFAAAKAYHVTQVVRGAETEQEAKAAMAVFNTRQITEYNTTVTRVRTAKQWREFNESSRVRVLPNIKWLPSRSVTIRASHERFYNRVWAKDDPFWSENMPGTEWNCKCDMQETHRPVTDNSDVPQPPVPRGLKGNPAVTGEIFSGDASYFQPNASRNKRDMLEKTLELANIAIVKEFAKQSLEGKTATCTIKGEQKKVEFIPQTFNEYAQSMQGLKEYFWLKNEILFNIQDYVEQSECVGRKASDTTHNTRKQTLRLKRDTEYFYYFKLKIPTPINEAQKEMFLHIGQKKTGEFYLYTATKNLPDNIETTF
jgi:hypothetical protein